MIYPALTFLFILSITLIVKFLVSMVLSAISNPPKKYEFDKYEPIAYIFLISYILTFLIYI
jgi:hypothetical protein